MEQHNEVLAEVVAILKRTEGVSEVTLELFFSSRRRHTRCSRDWSSGVCSSDLPGFVSDCHDADLLERLEAVRDEAGAHHVDASGARSEERRVGKESRSRWAP